MTLLAFWLIRLGLPLVIHNLQDSPVEPTAVKPAPP